ncbi:hypothetical protein NXV81_25085 [Bacteroides ovatus]|nr:hypothetical protein [Bacteroides ovatus]
MKLLVSNKVETNYEIALLILLNGGIWRLQFDLIHDEEQVKGRLFTYKLLVYHTIQKKSEGAGRIGRIIEKEH